MLTLSKIHEEIARHKYTKKELKYAHTIETIYWQYFFRLEAYYKELIEDIYHQSNNVSFPISTKPLEEYLSGFNFHYHPFDKYKYNKPKLEGFWEEDPNDHSQIHILYNTSGASIKRQRFTKIHETIHVFQFYDPEFRQFIDEFIVYETLPFDKVTHLMERVADKATAMFLVPAKELRKQYEQSPNPYTLSNYFQVSHQSIIYRLKNTGILVPT